jgi:hypothetical protein
VRKYEALNYEALKPLNGARLRAHNHITVKSAKCADDACLITVAHWKA